MGAMTDMAVAAKATPKVATVTSLPKQPMLKVGDIVHVVSGGRTLQNYMVLDFDDKLIKFRGNVQVAPQTEIVLIPWDKVDAFGLPNER